MRCIEPRASVCVQVSLRALTDSRKTQGTVPVILCPNVLCSTTYLEARCPLEADAELYGQPAAMLVGELAAFPVEGGDGGGEAAVAQEHVEQTPLGCCLGTPLVKGLCR